MEHHEEMVTGDKLAADMLILSGVLLTLSTATNMSPATSFGSPATFTTAVAVPAAGRSAVAFRGLRPVRVGLSALAHGPKEGAARRKKVFSASNEVTPKKNLNLGIISVEGDDCYNSRLRRLAYYVLQVPLYVAKFPLAVLLGMWSALFWRTPNETDVVAFVEGTGLIAVLYRGVPPNGQHIVDAAAPASVTAEPENEEQRRYYVDVQNCLLDHVTREPGKEIITPIDSWSMSYTKSRPIINSSGRTRAKPGPEKWAIHINSFLVNGKPVTDPASQMSFLHLYSTMGTHSKCHVYGNTLVQRINKDEVLRAKLMESTWNTVWLHRGLLRGGVGPLTAVRTEASKWAGLASPCRAEALIAESLEMSSLGGCPHGLAQRWIDLDLPLGQFMVEAREALRRVMVDHDIPMDLFEAIFLSVIMHSADHVLGSRYMWGLQFELDLWEQPARRPKICESAVWNFMWATPTINPLYDNKIRRIPKPFYRQLYQEMKTIDTFNLAHEITASIMY